MMFGGHGSAKQNKSENYGQIFNFLIWKQQKAFCNVLIWFSHHIQHFKIQLPLSKDVKDCLLDLMTVCSRVWTRESVAYMDAHILQTHRVVPSLRLVQLQTKIFVYKQKWSKKNKILQMHLLGLRLQASVRDVGNCRSRVFLSVSGWTPCGPW